MSASPLVDSTNSLKRPRSTHFNAGAEPAHKKQCSDDRKARCREESTAKLQTPVCDLERLLRRLAKNVDYATVSALKRVATGRECVVAMVQSIIERVKIIVAERSQGLEGSNKLLQAELYLEWLREYDFVLVAARNVLRAKVQIATGKTLFSILFHLIDEYISAVDAYQDGWSHGGPVERCAWVMTLVEEAKDSSTDERSITAVQQAETNLDRFDATFALAVQRYQAECKYWELSAAIGRKQETLARACCLLSEQTGYGGDDDGGYGLLVATREAMLRWKEQTSGDSPEDSGYET
ncbi:hypothetical protein B0H19DRAFT_1368270 [Mycena capillaripes]|nr:hypothetical protein B0H19DRAFT_1368270 [Mycena capillaripes]